MVKILNKRYTKYLNKFVNKVIILFRTLVCKLHNTHNMFVENRVYMHIRKECIDILLTGLALWIVLCGVAYITDFWRLANPLLIVPYGVVPWIIIQFVKELKSI